jgi:single-stranded-DNA-specific exonuclease
VAAEGAQLVITVDCGVTAVEQARRARQLGVDLVITDHHEPGPVLPQAVAVINPKCRDCAYPNKALSGAGVAFKLAHALLRRLHPDADAAREFLKSLLDLVALGTVADIVPLTGENRSLVAHGLARLREGGRVGLTSLLGVAQVQPSRVDTTDISFAIAPRLNAAGRTEHAMFSVELLLASDPDQARSLALRLEEFNRSRRDIEQAMIEQALELLEWDEDDRVLVVAQEGWHPGVLGIVASRLQTQFYRPVIVIGIDGASAKGSGRSVPGFDLHDALAHCEDHLIQFGGHKMAAGMSIETGRIDAFRRAINAHARGVLSADDLRPLVEIDVRADARELTREAVASLAALAPFGADNPKPVVSLEGLALVEPPRALKDRHLKLTLAGPAGQTLAALGWGMASRLPEIPMGGATLRLAGTPFLNTWNGRTSVELELKDFQVAG